MIIPKPQLLNWTPEISRWEIPFILKAIPTDFEQVVESIEFEDQHIDTAQAGLTIGVKVRDVVQEHDKVYKKER